MKPQVAAIPYQTGDQFMLCSDGITDGVWEKHIHSAFTKNKLESNSNDTHSNIVHQTILTRALENSGTDDTTIITITVS